MVSPFLARGPKSAQLVLVPERRWTVAAGRLHIRIYRLQNIKLDLPPKKGPFFSLHVGFTLFTLVLRYITLVIVSNHSHSLIFIYKFTLVCPP